MPKPSKSPIAQLRAALLERCFRQESADVYSDQEHRGDLTTYRILGNSRVNVTVRCWRISDGWSDETMSATEALDRLTSP